MNIESRAFKAALRQITKESADDPNMIGFANQICTNVQFQPSLPLQGAIDICFAVWDISKDKPGGRANSMAGLLSRRIHRMARLFEETPRRRSAGAKARAKGLRLLARYVSRFNEHEANVTVALAILFRAAPEGSSIEDFFDIENED